MHFPISVVCEGASEVNYIAELNRLLIAYTGSMAFYPMDAHGSKPKQLASALRKIQGSNRKHTCWIFFCDEDVFVREKDLRHSLEERVSHVEICWSRMNFEDTLLLHESQERLNQWLETLTSMNHFRVPLTEDAYLPLFLKFFPSYRKRELPFELTKDRVKQAFENLHNQSQIRSGLLLQIENLLIDQKLAWR